MPDVMEIQVALLKKDETYREMVEKVNAGTTRDERFKVLVARLADCNELLARHGFGGSN